MTTGQKIAALRRERGMTQGALAEALSVTRQAVSKWEADAALPETGKLLPLARLLGCTADYLLGSSEAEAGAPQGAPNTAAQSSEPKGAQGREPHVAPQGSEPQGTQGHESYAVAQSSEPNAAAQGEPQEPTREKPAHDEPAQEKTAHEDPAQGRAPFIPYWGLPRRYVWASDFEYKSKRTLFGLPLVHICVGTGRCRARGIFAVGNEAVGIVAVGIASVGVLSVGAASAGLFAIAALSLALVSVGAVAVGLLAVGAIAVGVRAVGSLSVGVYSMGACAVASRIASTTSSGFARAPVVFCSDGAPGGRWEILVSDFAALLSAAAERFSVPDWLLRLLSAV